MVAPKPILLDCDPGVDDALAIALALASPELRLEAITAVAGNCSVDRATENALRVLETCRRLAPWDLLPLPPVHRGASRPLRGGSGGARGGDAEFVHGPGGLGGVGAMRRPGGEPRYPLGSLRPARGSAVACIIERARSLGRRLTVVATGPLTNLALAMREAPEVMGGVGGIILMGGAARPPGNTTALAEFNIFCDPEAAREVFAFPLPLTMVGLDVTRRVMLRAGDLRGKGRFRRFLRDLTRFYMEFHRRVRGVRGCYLHDPLALALAIDPSFVRTRELCVEVEAGKGPARGMTAVDFRTGKDAERRGRLLRVALEVEAERFLRFFLERLGRYDA